MPLPLFAILLALALADPAAAFDDALYARLLQRHTRAVDGRAGGRTVTLDEIEHEIVRPLGDPRTHAVVICASTSCPALPREPLTANRLDAQLDAAVRQWLADPGKGLRIDRAANTVHLSK